MFNPETTQIIKARTHTAGKHARRGYGALSAAFVVLMVVWACVSILVEVCK